MKGIGVGVMNPVCGGSLAANTGPILRLLPGAKTAAEVAMRYALDTLGVTTALSGMNTVEQVLENTKIASRKSYMTKRQREVMEKGLAQFKQHSMQLCTSCGYCMPCPHNVDVPNNFLYLNRAKFLGLKESAAKDLVAHFKTWSKIDKTALVCKKCGMCLPKCPNKIPIINQLEEVAELIKKTGAGQCCEE